MSLHNTGTYEYEEALKREWARTEPFQPLPPNYAKKSDKNFQKVVKDELDNATDEGWGSPRRGKVI